MGGEKNDLLDALMAFDNALFEYLLQCAPATDEEKAAVAEVKQLRTRLQQHQSRISLERFQAATADVKQHVARLKALTKDVKATTGAIAKVKEVGQACGEVVGIAGGIAGAVL